MSRKRVLLRCTGKRIKEMRKRYGLDQEGLAKKFDISLATVKNWEQGYNYPTIDTLVQLSDFFHCDLDYLLGKQDTPNKVYKHFSEETGLSETAIQNLLYFCKSSKIINNLLENGELLFLLDSCACNDYTDTKITLKSGNASGIIDNAIIYRLDKMDLYNCICDLIDDYRKQNRLETIQV